MFSCEFSEISKNTFFTEHLWTTASPSKFWACSYSLRRWLTEWYGIILQSICSADWWIGIYFGHGKNISNPNQ